MGIGRSEKCSGKVVKGDQNEFIPSPAPPYPERPAQPPITAPQRRTPDVKHVFFFMEYVNHKRVITV